MNVSIQSILHRRGWQRPFGWALVCLLATSGAHAQKYRAERLTCFPPKSQVEKMVCETGGLLTLNSRMRSRYAETLQNPKNTRDQKTQLIAQQEAWERQRDACTTSECLKRVYAANPFVQQSRPRYGMCGDVNADWPANCGRRNGKGYAVCEAYLQHLNSLKEVSPCHITPQPPQFKSPPWQELDVLQHLDWAYQIEVKLREYSNWKPPSLEVWSREFLKMLQTGQIAPHMKKTRLKPPGQEEITLLAYTGDRLKCERTSTGENLWLFGYEYWKIPEEANAPIRPLFDTLSQSGELFLFSGKPVWVTYHPEFTNIDQMYPFPYDGSSMPLCGIDPYQ